MKCLTNNRYYTVHSEKGEEAGNVDLTLHFPSTIWRVLSSTCSFTVPTSGGNFGKNTNSVHFDFQNIFLMCEKI